MIFNQRYREYRKGDRLNPKDVSPATLRFLKKKGVLDEGKIEGGSGELTIAQVKEKVSSMTLEEAFSFTAGDERKGIARLRDELVQSTG